MSRFSNLEFDESRKKSGEPALQGTPIRDAAYYGNRADERFLAGDFELALRFYSRSLEQNAAWFEGWFGQVRMLIELNEYPEALLWADKALQMFPENPELLAAKAVACVRNGEIDKALAYSDNALSRPNGTSYVWLARAEILAEQQRSTSEECVRNALALAGPRMGFVRLEAGRLLLRAGRLAAAMEHLEQATMLLPNSALAWLELGRCQGALGYSQAAVSLRQCLHWRPNWDEAYALLDRYDTPGFWRRLRNLFRGK